MSPNTQVYGSLQRLSSKVHSDIAFVRKKYDVAPEKMLTVVIDERNAWAWSHPACLYWFKQPDSRWTRALIFGGW